MVLCTSGGTNLTPVLFHQPRDILGANAFCQSPHLTVMEQPSPLQLLDLALAPYSVFTLARLSQVVCSLAGQPEFCAGPSGLLEADGQVDRTVPRHQGLAPTPNVQDDDGTVVWNMGVGDAIARVLQEFVSHSGPDA